jgi:hypothetical protein
MTLETVMLSIANKPFCAECRYAECRGASKTTNLTSFSLPSPSWPYLDDPQTYRPQSVRAKECVFPAATDRTDMEDREWLRVSSSDSDLESFG